MEELTLSTQDIQKIVTAIGSSKDTIGDTSKTKGWKFAEDFHMAYFQGIVQNILGLILARVKDQLKKTDDHFATKHVFNEAFPTNRRSTFVDTEVLGVVEAFFTDEVMATLIKEKMTYQSETFGVGGEVKVYRISKEFTEAVRKLLAVKVVYYTNGLLLVCQNGVLSADDIKKYGEISGTTEHLIEGITGSFRKLEVKLTHKRTKSPHRRGRSPRKKAGSPRVKRKNKENNNE